MSYIKPSVDDFKDFFVRDFPYGDDIQTSVTDKDIQNAYLEANVNFNECLWDSQETFTLGYLLLSAHYLVLNIQASSQGISGQFNWVQTSKSVGSVSEGFQVPQRIMDNPEFAFLSKTNYGARYLALVLPLLSGAIFSVAGSTRP